jgi:hypothetical protein
VERLDRALERKAVRDERLEVDEPARHEPEGLGVLVGVAVLELEVDLVGREVAERELARVSAGGRAERRAPPQVGASSTTTARDSPFAQTAPHQ